MAAKKENRGGWRGVSKPKLPEGVKRRAITVRLPPDLIERAKKIDGGMTAAIERALILFFKSEK